MNAITKTSASPRSLSPSHDKAARDILDAAHSTLFRDYPAMPAMLLEPLPPAVRETLELRRSNLAASLAPAAKAEHRLMANAISGMLGAFGGAVSGSVEAVVSTYVHILRDLPLWAVQAACEAIARGEVEDASLDHRPPAPRLRRVARSIMAPWDEEMFRLREVLNAEALKPEDEEMRKRLGALMGSFADDLRMGKFKPEEVNPSALSCRRAASDDTKRLARRRLP